VILLGLVRVDEDKRIVYKNPSDNFKIKTDDYLIMLMNQKTQKKIKKVFELEEGI
jgi:voltage-gated potassium channel